MTFMARAAGARLVIAGPALVGLTMLVGGCGTATNSSPTSDTSAPAASPANSADPLNPTGAPASSGSGAQTPVPATTLTAPPAFGLPNPGYACPMSSVRVTLGLAQGSQGVVYQVIDFTNRGPKQCSLGGSPGASLAGGSPLAQIGLAATTAPAGARPRITLNPGQVANALLQISNASNFTKAACDPVHASYLVIAVPNTLGFVKLPYSTTACANSVQLLSMGGLAHGSGG
jgi:uncharacterized protein DUF4232